MGAGGWNAAVTRGIAWGLVGRLVRLWSEEGRGGASTERINLSTTHQPSFVSSTHDSRAGVPCDNEKLRGERVGAN